MDLREIWFESVNWGQVAGSCEEDNEPSVPWKGGEFLDKLSVQPASQEGLCAMELVRHLKLKFRNSGFNISATRIYYEELNKFSSQWFEITCRRTYFDRRGPNTNVRKTFKIK
jgi:hypothetical protein